MLSPSTWINRSRQPLALSVLEFLLYGMADKIYSLYVKASTLESFTQCAICPYYKTPAVFQNCRVLRQHDAVVALVKL